MATVKVTITDGPSDSITIRVESEHPALPIDGDGNPELDKLTPAQAMAIGALMEMSDHTGEWDWRTLLVG